MAIAVASTANNSATSSSSVVITKPTGLAVGDLMIAVLAASATTTVDINTPSGWTAVTDVSLDSGRVDIFYRVADSGDVAASNFTFNTSISAALFGGSLMRVTGFLSSDILDTFADAANNTANSATISFASSVTAEREGSLFVMVFGANDGNSGVGSISGYTTTGGSLTFTELFDYSLDESTRDPIIGGAYAIQGAATSVTAFGATLSNTKDNHAGIMAIFRAVIDASGTAALHSADADFFAPAASSGTSGTAVLHSASGELFTQSGRATTQTQWAAEAPDATSWVNETL